MDRQEYKTQNSKRDSERQARIEKEANTVNWLHFWRWRPTWWNVPSEKFAFLVALFTGVLAVVAYKQLTATQGQLTEMQIQSAVTRTQLRANLKLTMANYVINNDGKAFAWIFTPVWKNAGTTEALRANGWDDSQFFPNDAPEKFDFLHPRNKLPDVPFAKSIPQGDELIVLRNALAILSASASLFSNSTIARACFRQCSKGRNDLMEPQRPIVDRKVLEFVQAKTFHPADFTIRSDGVCRLNPEMARCKTLLRQQQSFRNGLNRIADRNVIRSLKALVASSRIKTSRKAKLNVPVGVTNWLGLVSPTCKQ
jgi:hypothetical protein